MLFGQIAIEKNLITPQQLNEALEIKSRKPDWFIGEILAFLSYLEDSQIQEILEDQGIYKSHKIKAYKKIKMTHLKTTQPDLQQTLDRPSPGQITRFFKSRNLGRYQIIDEIGCGGMGRVYRAHDKELDRDIALKVVISGGAASNREIERFIREARATAKLCHPNIVVVHDIGSIEGQYFFTMDFIEGYSLKDFFKNNPSYEHFIETMIKVGEAVEYAHQQEIIHRDLKSSNIMVDGGQEPKVMDFGLAKIPAHDSLSKTGDVLGTPAYMSPEQVQSKAIDHRSDIFSMGITIYEVLTQRLPFQGESYLHVLYQIVHADPIAPRKLNPQIPMGLEAICLKCLEKDPDKRYQTAAMLVADLKNTLEHRPIIAKAPGSFKSLRKIFVRNRLLLIALVVIAVNFIWLGILYTRENQQWQDTQMQLVKITLYKARKAQDSKEWRACGVYAGKALKLLQKVKTKKIQALKKQGLNFVINAFVKSKVETPGRITSEIVQKALKEDPQQTTQAIFGLKVTEVLTVKPLDKNRQFKNLTWLKRLSLK